MTLIKLASIASVINKKSLTLKKFAKKLAILLFLSTVTLHSTVSKADPEDTFNFIAGVNTQFDNNVFRVANNADSDAITTTYAGFRLDKLYAMQRFRFEYTRNQYRYRDNDFLNYGANNYNGAWYWAITPALKGRLFADQVERLISFSDFIGQRRKIIGTTKRQGVDFDFSPHNVWHLLGGYTHVESENSQVFSVADGYKANMFDYGVKYQFRSGNAITFMGHNRDGRFERTASPISFLDNGFDEKEYEIKADWRVSGKSLFAFKWGYVDREYNNFNVRDYSGAIGRIAYTWQPTGHLQFITSWARDIRNFDTNSSSYIKSDTVTFSPTYNLSSKLLVKGNLLLSNSEFLGNGNIPSLIDREDDLRSAGVALTWLVNRNIDIGANLDISSRNSNVDFFDFSDRTAGLSINLLF